MKKSHKQKIWRLFYPDGTESTMNYDPLEYEREKLLKSELRFLNSQAIKHLVHEADFGACHDVSPTIENRKKKLKKLLLSGGGRNG